MSDTQALTEREIVTIAKALADPRRFGILTEVAQTGSVRCQAVRKVNPVSAATISHHVKELEAAGLIEILRFGKCATLRFRGETMRLYLDSLARAFPAALELPLSETII